MVARLLWEQDAAGSNPVSPMPRDARSQLAVQPPESGGFFVPTGSGAPLQSQHGARSVTTTRCGVDGNMHSGIVPIARPRASNGAFLCARSGVDACRVVLAWSHRETSSHASVTRYRDKGGTLLAGLETPLTRGGLAWRHVGPFPQPNQPWVQRDAACKS